MSAVPKVEVNESDGSGSASHTVAGSISQLFDFKHWSLICSLLNQVSCLLSIEVLLISMLSLELFEM